MGIALSGVSLVEGCKAGILDVYLLHIVSSENHKSSVLVRQSELEDLQKGSVCERLELRIRFALENLQIIPQS
jgi:hypothetical protein